MLGLPDESRAGVAIEPTTRLRLNPEEDLSPSRATKGEAVDASPVLVIALVKPPSDEGRKRRRVNGTRLEKVIGA